MDTDDKAKVVQLERSVLRLMCSGEFHEGAIVEAWRELAAYNWQGQDNRVVFDALTRVRNADLVPIRAQLAEHATRMGFPEIDWGIYFRPTVAEPDDHKIDRREMKQAIKALLLTQKNRD